VTPDVETTIRRHYQPRTPGVIGRLARILGWSSSRVSRAVAKLGLPRRTRTRWTPEQDRFLMRWAGERSPKWISYRMRKEGLGNHSPRSIVDRFKRLDISYRIVSGYTIADVAECFGVCPTLVRRWLEKGYIDTRGASKDSRGNIRFTDRILRTFVRKHPQEYSFQKVDQEWFLRMIFSEEEQQGVA
jgi:hypothetical protein